MFLILISVIVFLLVLEFLFNQNAQARLFKEIPGPKDVFLVGNLLDIPLTPVSMMKIGREYAKRWNAGIYRFWCYPVAAIFIFNPDDVEKVISTVTHNEKSIIYTFLEPWLKQGLLLSSGSKWQQRRKILTPSFHFNILKQFHIVLEENSRRLVEVLHNCDGQSVDVLAVLSEYTLNSICETAMGTRLDEETTAASRNYKNALNRISYFIFERFCKIYYYCDFIFNISPTGKKFNKYLNTVHSFTKEVIKKRKTYLEENKVLIIDPSMDITDDVYDKKRRTAMLDLLISAEKEGLINDDGIQEEVDTFMFEGHDTTASGLAFCFMILANHKNIQDKILLELNEIFGESNRTANMADLTKMKYLECCIKESLRLYPPVHFISRNISETMTLSNYTVPKGSVCHITILDLHRREDLFKDPLVFDPDRFLPENCIGRHPYAYIPFSAGPRNCIGQKFAMMEMKAAVSTVLREFELVPMTRPSDIEFTAGLILKNSTPIYVKFVKRT